MYFHAHFQCLEAVGPIFPSVFLGYMNHSRFGYSILISQINEVTVCESKTDRALWDPI